MNAMIGLSPTPIGSWTLPPISVDSPNLSPTVSNLMTPWVEQVIDIEGKLASLLQEEPKLEFLAEGHEEVHNLVNID